MSEFSGLSVLPAPKAGWARGPLRERDDEPLDRWTVRQIERHRIMREMQTLLGTVMRDTTVLTRPGLPHVIAYDRSGKPLRWSLWAPHKLLLIDVYRVQLPPVAELEDRDKFAQAENFRYGLVEPGKRLTLEALRAWLTGEED